MATQKFNIQVYSDNVCPWCFVGKRNLEAAIATQQLKDRTEVHWKPFFLDVNRKESDEPIMAHINKKYGKAAGERMSAALKRAGAGQGINFTDDRKVHNTLLSHRLVHLAEQQGKQGEVIEAIFKGYFEHGINLSDINTLVDIAEAAGVQDSRAYLESDQDADIVLREYKDGLKRYNISGVPFFIITREGNKEKITLSGAQPVDEFEAAFEALS